MRKAARCANSAKSTGARVKSCQYATVDQVWRKFAGFATPGGLPAWWSTTQKFFRAEESWADHDGLPRRLPLIANNFRRPAFDHERRFVFVIGQ